MTPDAIREGTIYYVPNWFDDFESYESSRIPTPTWVRTPNNFDSNGYAYLRDSLEPRDLPVVVAVWEAVRKTLSRSRVIRGTFPKKGGGTREAFIRLGVLAASDRQRPILPRGIAARSGFDPDDVRMAFGHLEDVGWLRSSSHSVVRFGVAWPCDSSGCHPDEIRMPPGFHPDDIALREDKRREEERRLPPPQIDGGSVPDRARGAEGPREEEEPRSAGEGEGGEAPPPAGAAADLAVDLSGSGAMPSPCGDPLLGSIAPSPHSVRSLRVSDVQEAISRASAAWDQRVGDGARWPATGRLRVRERASIALRLSEYADWPAFEAAFLARLDALAADPFWNCQGKKKPAVPPELGWLCSETGWTRAERLVSAPPANPNRMPTVDERASEFREKLKRMKS